jgi:hypothetical protein
VWETLTSSSIDTIDTAELLIVVELPMLLILWMPWNR